MYEPISSRWIGFTRNQFAKAMVLVSLVLGTAILANAKSFSTRPPTGSSLVQPSGYRDTGERPRIEVVFVLDTTGSMSGLISGAKQKIWSIVNQMASAYTTPEIRIGLIGYRDRGDQYVTKRFDLTDDIDALYGKLQSLSAGGGGDGPESVNQALNEAVVKMSWSRDPNVYKVVFLVGDASPHMDYQDDIPYATSVTRATRDGIVINTIQCGNGAETARVFASIADLSQGEYASISQDGAMVASHTPMDEKLATLNMALAETVVAYGEKSERDELHQKIRRSLAAAPTVVASRLSYFAKKGGAVNSGRGDLVAAVAGDEVDLDEISPEALPPVMQGLSAAERNTYLTEKTQRRDELQVKISQLTRSRDAFLKRQSQERAAEGEDNAFDDKLLGTLRSQAAEKGIVY